MHRVDQALGNHVLATACSSFIIDWTYEDGVGFTLNPNGPVDFVGVNIPASYEQRWFGLNAAGDPEIRRLCPSCPVAREGLLRSAFFPPAQRALAHANIDRYDIPDVQGIPDTLHTFAGERIMIAGASAVYEAIFGYNQTLPLDIKGTLWADPAVAYTPWPTAIRITMTLHDADNRLEAGREVQFVIDLPRR